MRSILYLWLMSIKNWLLELKKKPGLLILYLLLIVIFVGVGVLSKVSGVHPDAEANFPIFKMLFFALSASFIIFGVYRGLSGGGSFFDMCDVNLLFVSPLNPRVILIHGITRQLKAALVAGIFILYQTQSMKYNFGISFSSMLIVLGGFIFALLLTETLSIFIYSKTSVSALRRNIVKIITALMFLPVFAKLAALLMEDPTNPLGAVFGLADTWCVDFLPIAGWVTRGCTDIIAGNASGAVFLLAALVLEAAMTVMITAGKIDYYEDVLCASESNYERQRAKTEGNLSDMTSKKKVRVSRTGISGFGASTFFSKHVRESGRTNFAGVISASSGVFMIGALFISLILRETLNLINVMQMLMWVQVFMVGSGKGMKELFSHYIYMIPESSVSKLIWSNAESFLRAFIESLVILSVIGFIMKESVLIVIGCILVFTLFTLFLIAVNYLSMRALREVTNRGLLVFFYILFVMIVMVPGVIAAIIIGSMTAAFIGLLILAGWECGLGVLFFFLSRGVLHECDIVTLKSS